MSSALEVFFYVSHAYSDEGGGILLLKTSRSKRKWPFSTKCLNLIAIWEFIVWGVQLDVEIVDGMHLYGEISLPIVIINEWYPEIFRNVLELKNVITVVHRAWDVTGWVMQKEMILQ